MLLKFVVPLVLGLLSLFGGAVWLLDVNPLPQQAERGATQKEAAAEETAPKPAAENPASDLEALKEALAPSDAKSPGDAPAFDIARIDPEGASVFAGTGEPNSRVTITADGEAIGTADVDENGEWALTIDKPISNPDAKLALFKAAQSGSAHGSERDRVAARAGERQDGGTEQRDHGAVVAEAGDASNHPQASRAARPLPLSPPNIAGNGNAGAVAQATAGSAEHAAAADATTPAGNAGDAAAPASGAAAAVKADQMKNLEGMVAEARAEAEAEAKAAKEAHGEAETHAGHVHQAEPADAGADAAGAPGQQQALMPKTADSSDEAAKAQADAPAGTASDSNAASDDRHAEAAHDHHADAGGGAAQSSAQASPSAADAGGQHADTKPTTSQPDTVVSNGAATAIAEQVPAAAASAAALPPATALSSEPPQNAATASELAPATEVAAADLSPTATAREASANVAATSLSVPVPVTFVYNQSTLTAEGRRAAGLLLEYLQIKRFPNVTLTGHADERGSHELNMRLSRDRLEAVATFLREGGYEGSLELVPKGKTEPYLGVVRGDFAQDDLWQLDRRVELVISR
ncbi:OmpA family protein [Hyphomicrobium sp. D-2]|uniref:OmpA family protein n=1 Tax=Hyphomicrobium sp. D-2 TaxID=3041621 RepID=UPI00245755C0|nr:OmpA family protein [Hyphomicrobium sp. D-2]MDH4983136.1 OmpA family protein [Hyphomicrobium sp. D-2]